MKNILTSLLLLVLVSCGSTNPGMSVSEQPMKVVKDGLACMPVWMIDIPTDTFAYEGESKNSGMASLRAENVARAQMAAAEEAFVEALVKDVMIDSGLSESDADYFSAAFKTVVDGKVEGFRVLKRSFCETDNGRVKAYVLTTFDYEALAAKYEAQRKALEASKRAAAAKEAFADLEGEIEKLRARKAAEVQ